MTEKLLQLAPQLTPHAIEWLIEGSTFVIRGCVSTYHQKQLATTVACKWPGIERVVNELEVQPRLSPGATASHDRN